MDAPNPYVEKIEKGIFSQKHGYFVKVSVNGIQQRVPAATLDEARQIRSELQAQQQAYRSGVHTSDRLPTTHTPREGDPVAHAAEVEPEEVEISDALRPAYDALTEQRDQLQERAAPLREELAGVERSIERVQGAIDALEGREPDASADLRQPGSLKTRLPANVRAAFAAPGEKQISRAEGRMITAATLDVIKPGELLARREVWERVCEVLEISQPIKADQISRALVRWLERGRLVRVQGDTRNPADIKYRLADAGDPDPQDDDED